ncbi:MAG: S1C family serine protease [Lachnospiraceae bacterium]|nr:S1C family serine protease [Lachnospiraceae bacterium]
MSKDFDNENEKLNNQTGKAEIGVPGDKESKEFVFMREQIKSRPINKSKLAKNTLFSALSAVIFGLVACVTFFLLAPVVSGYLEKDEKTEEVAPLVVFPEETIEEEMRPEDMLITSEPDIDWSEIEALSEEEIAKAISSIEFTVADYQKLFKSMTSIARDAEKCLVKVRGVKTDTDWFDNMFEESGEVPGLIVADNGVNMFILTYASLLSNADDLYVTFPNDISVRAYMHAKDPLTDLCIVTVPRLGVNEATRRSVEVANLGISNSSMLSGSLVIAIGSPMGTYDSLNIGLVTQLGKKIKVSDHNYKRLSTDIYGSSKATGVLVNLKGEVIGVISTRFTESDTENLINAIGISELKKTIEDMINGQDLVYLGINGANVPEEAVYQNNAPKGAFVLSLDMDSPAMNGGIQAGDIIVDVGGKSIPDYATLVETIREMNTETETEIIACRMSQDGYKRISFSIKPTVLQ